MSDIADRGIESASDMDTHIQHEPVLMSDADNRAYWHNRDAELNDLMEVVEDGGD